MEKIMEKITFTQPGEETAEFYIVGQTVISGNSYILVTDSEDGDADAMILRDDSKAEDEEAIYSAVEDEEELAACAAAFKDLLDGEDILLEA